METIQQSDSVDQLFTALAKAQAAMTYAKRDAKNPHYKSTYADLASVWDAVREPMTANGLSVVQLSCGSSLVTQINHSSGQWMRGSMPLAVKDLANPQAWGSGMTYARRYALAGACGVAQDDDDGNAAQAHQTGKRAEFEKLMLPLMRHPKAGEALAGMGYEALADVPEAMFRSVYGAIKNLGEGL